MTRNLLASLIVLTFFWMALGSLVDDSPAMDEQNHLGRGIAYLNSGDPRLSVEHPPLVNLLAALPTSLLPLDIPLDEPAFRERFPHKPSGIALLNLSFGSAATTCGS